MKIGDFTMKGGRMYYLVLSGWGKVSVIDFKDSRITKEIIVENVNNITEKELEL